VIQIFLDHLPIPKMNHKDLSSTMFKPKHNTRKTIKGPFCLFRNAFSIWETVYSHRRPILLFDMQDTDRHWRFHRLHNGRMEGLDVSLF
jgi:hypothetical protein